MRTFWEKRTPLLVSLCRRTGGRCEDISKLAKECFLFNLYCIVYVINRHNLVRFTPFYNIILRLKKSYL